MKIERKTLITALEALKPALASRSSIKALSHVWFDKKYAYAHDGGLGIRVKLETPLKLGVPGALLPGLLSQPGTETLTLESDDQTLTFKAGKSNVKLATLDYDSRVWPYPDVPKGDPAATITVSEGLVRALKRVLVVRASQPRRMEHYGVAVYAVDKKEMDLYTTDSNRLAVAPLAEGIVGKVEKLVLPRIFVEQVISQAQIGKEIEFYSDHFRIQATDDVSIFSNVFDTSDMLDLPGKADQLADERAAPPFSYPKDLTATLERAVVMAGSDDPAVLLSVNGKRLTLAGRFKYGELDEEFEINKSVAKRSILVTASSVLAVKDAERMAIGASALMLYGKYGFMYASGAYTREKAQEAKAA
jgi:hypothetical protein